jgi:hypothetical protein
LGLRSFPSKRCFTNSLSSTACNHRLSTAVCQPPLGCQPVDRLTEAGSQQTVSSAIESFSVCNSTRDDRNQRVRGRFRAACGSGERSKPRTRPICDSFYPQKLDSGPRRECARPETSVIVMSKPDVLVISVIIATWSDIPGALVSSGPCSV